jgi:hypothetical protein
MLPIQRLPLYQVFRQRLHHLSSRHLGKLFLTAFTRNGRKTCFNCLRQSRADCRHIRTKCTVRRAAALTILVTPTRTRPLRRSLRLHSVYKLENSGDASFHLIHASPGWIVIFWPRTPAALAIDAIGGTAGTIRWRPGMTIPVIRMVTHWRPVSLAVHRGVACILISP